MNRCCKEVITQSLIDHTSTIIANRPPTEKDYQYHHFQCWVELSDTKKIINVYVYWWQSVDVKGWRKFKEVPPSYKE